MAANERLTLEIVTQASGQEQVNALTAALNRFSDTAANAGKSGQGLSGNVRNIGDAFGHTVPQMAAASAAVRAFEGTLSVRAVERFLTGVLQIGPALQAAFPVIGALAFGEILVELYEKVTKFLTALRDAPRLAASAFRELNDALAHSNDQLRVTGDNLANDIAKLEGKPQNNLKVGLDEAALAASGLSVEIDKALAGLEKLLKEHNVGGLKAFFTGQRSTDGSDEGLQRVQEQVANAQRIGYANIRNASTDPEKKAAEDAARRSVQDILNGELSRRGAQVEEAERLQRIRKGGKNVLPIDDQTEFIKNNDAVIENLQGQLERVSQAPANADAEAKKKNLEASKEGARAATEALKKADEDGLAHLEATHRLSIGEVIKYWQQRLAVESSNAERVHEITDKIGVAKQRQFEVFDNIAKAGREAEKREDEKADKRQKFMAGITEDADAAGDAMAQHIVEAATKLADIQARGDEAATVGGLDQQRLAVQRSGLLGPNSQKISGRIAEYQQLRQIDQQEATARVAAETEILNRLKALGIGHEDQVAEQENRITDIRARAREKEYSDETRMLQEIHAEREKELQGFRSEVGDVFDAITSRQQGALANLLKSQALGIGKQITENIAEQYLYPTIKKAIPRATDPNSGIGKILQGTPFGADPLKLSTDLNTTATIANTAALGALKIAAMSPSGGGGSASGLGGIFSGSSGGGVFHSFGSGETESEGTFSGIGENGDVAGETAGGMGGSGFGMNASTLTKAAAAGAGAFAAFQGFKSGGVRGDIQGVSGGLASAAAIAAMTGAEPVALGLGIASAVTGFVAAVLPDPKTVRENAINKELATNQYQAPTALNLTQDSSGHYTDFDARGNIRTSNFSPYPETTNPFIWQQTHGLFGGPPTYYPVPGGTQQPYSPGQSPAPIIQHIYQAGAIQTMDGASFHEFAQKNARAIGDAAGKHLQDAGESSRLGAAVNYITR